MSPSFPSGQPGDRGLIYAISRSDLALKHRPARYQRTDFTDGIRRQLGRPMFSTARGSASEYVVGVDQVFGKCDPFKVGQSIVRPDSVLVINVRSARISTDKRQKNETMYPDSAANTVSVEADLMVAASEVEEFRPEDHSGLSASNASVATDSTKRGHAVKTFVSNNRTPFFFHTGEIVYRPSAERGH